MGFVYKIISVDQSYETNSLDKSVQMKSLYLIIAFLQLDDVSLKLNTMATNSST